MSIKPANTRISPFDSLASVYDDWFEEEGKLPFAIEVRAFQEILPFLPKPWLDIGVGSGRFAQALGIETGIDPSIKLLEIAKKRGITTLTGRGEQQSFAKESFGTVFLIVTLCFLDSPLDVLREAYRILMPDGKVALGLVLRESPWGKFYQRKQQQGHRFYKYATFYSYDELIGLLEEAGFLLEKVVSTLFQKPDRVENMESPRNYYSADAGFTVLVAHKRVSQEDNTVSEVKN